MSTDGTSLDLTPNQILALVVLMAEARELTNKELTALAGFSLTGRDNAKLVELGLVETNKSRRPFSHLLTDKGWGELRELHLSEPPKTGKSAIRSLFTLLANVRRSLDQLPASHAAFFKQGGDAPDPETAIRAAYAELSNAPGDWVGLADLREQLDNLDRAAVDEALRALLRQSGVRIIPVANTKALEPRDRVAALRIGDEDNHALAIGQP